MRRLTAPLSCLLLAACAAEPLPAPESLLQGAGDARGVLGLERLEAAGPYLAGQRERFRVHVDGTLVERVTFSASAGALSSSGNAAEWTLPTQSIATLTAEVLHRDGTQGRQAWEFVITGGVGASAQQALLATPMPVFDGGTLEVSGGACDVQYEGTTTNVALAFTSETHPSVTYGRWDGNAWTLEVVDGMGFNVGGVISTYVALRVSANGTPHLLYVRSGQLIYATRSNNTWLRERVDTATYALNTITEPYLPSLALDGAGNAVVLYSSTDPATGGYARPAIAQRSGAGAWTQAAVHSGAFATGNNVYPTGELVIDGARFVFPVSNSSLADSFLYSVTAGVASSLYLSAATNVFATFADGVLASAGRVIYRGFATVYDVALNATFSSTTFTESRVESGGGASAGDIAWAQTRPVVLHQHGSSLELVTTNAGGYWTYTQLGTSSGTSASLAVHPASGVASICYQSAGRIIFQ